MIRSTLACRPPGRKRPAARHRSIALAPLAALALALVPRPALGATLYATSLDNQKIVQVDTTTNTVTTVQSLSFQPDSLIFSNPTTIVFTGISNGTLDQLDLTTHTVTQLASGLNGPRDVTLEPGGNTVLVSDSNNDRIERVNLTTHAVSLLASGFFPDGITYDNAGHLFVVDDRGLVLQLDPTTGATINSIRLPTNNADGITYDSFTGKLWVTDFNGGVISVDTGLTTTQEFGSPFGSGQDGIEGDGNGTLFVASRDFHVYEFSILGHTWKQDTFVSGLDDLAPVVGLGSPQTAPEPASLTLLGLGVVSLAGYSWRRRKVAAAC
jgi:DNA-binding beta-propeller fold protein YncE